ncbi:hypothetical protein ACO0LC_21905 [Undibacterium sp. JH2W]|uniref:hypothetical protein n=1 Tax=Undibacterium sp. JH2W TaxID=3413037 RepID=UPI003BF01C33
MGTWGAALYDDDVASDLKNTLALLCKVPADGDGLLKYLKQLHGEPDPAEGDEAYFWLVTADQFEKRGIACVEVSTNALAIIENDVDLESARDKGADEKFLKKRAAVLDELASRLNAPRPVRDRKTAAKPPDMMLQTGEVYAFPTMQGLGWNPYSHLGPESFVPDGWGALIVLETGRMFDWLPWCALASLAVNPVVKPTLLDAMHGQMIFHLQTQGAGRFVPKKKHVQGLGLELLGHVTLDPALVAPHLSKWPVAAAIECDWTISYAAYSGSYKGLPRACELEALLKIN